MGEVMDSVFIGAIAALTLLTCAFVVGCATLGEIQ